MAQDDKAPFQSIPDKSSIWPETNSDRILTDSSVDDVNGWEFCEGENEIWFDQNNQPVRQSNKSVQSKKKSNHRQASNGLKKSSLKKARKMDMPPTPIGCEWRETDGGWNLFRCWSEKDEVMGGRYKKERYVGYLGREAWQVMKQYDYETFIAIIGQRFRRHSGR